MDYLTAVVTVITVLSNLTTIASFVRSVCQKRK